jgi:hypothetical protein
MTKKQKNSRELDYSTKWKKISSSRTEILVENRDGSEIISIGFVNLRVSTRKWATEASFKPKAFMTQDSSKSQTFHTDIEAGRALKELWLKKKKYDDFQVNLDKLNSDKQNKDNLVYTSAKLGTYNSSIGGKYNTAPFGGGDDSFSDDEWEDLLTDFSLDGD